MRWANFHDKLFLQLRWFFEPLEEAVVDDGAVPDEDDGLRDMCLARASLVA